MAETKGESRQAGRQTVLDQLDVLGVLPHAAGHRLIVRRAAPPNSAIFPIPMRHLGSRSGATLQALLLDHGFSDLVLNLGADAIGQALLAASAKAQRTIIDRPGLHQFVINEQQFAAQVHGGRIYWLTDPPPTPHPRVIGEAAKKPQPSRTLQDFNRQLAPVLAANPRLLVLLCFALAAPWWRALNRLPLNVALIGASSSGKSIAQNLVSQLVGIEESIHGFDVSNPGLTNLLAERPDRAVFFEDTQGPRAAQPLLKAIMASGNRNAAIRATTDGGVADREAISATICISAEKSLAEIARDGHQLMNAGIRARVFEINMGRHGIFDQLGGMASGRDLAEHLRIEGEKYSGLISAALISHISKNWPLFQERCGARIKQTREKILKSATNPAQDPISIRVLDGLAFAARLGAYACAKGVLQFDQSIVIEAFATLFSEYSNRIRRSEKPGTTELIVEVRQFVLENRRRFLAMAIDIRALPTHAVGFKKRMRDGEELYLFPPNMFAKVFGADRVRQILLALAEAGHLRTTDGRGYHLAVRTNAERSGRLDVIAVRRALVD